MAESRKPRLTLRRGITAALLFSLCALLIAAPSPPGLPVAGQKVIAVAILTVGLWCTEALAAGTTGVVLILALLVTGGVQGVPEALSGFADPVAYFLVGVLTIGLAVSKSGLADRVARWFLRRSSSSARAFYLELLYSFPLLTLILPSATTRSGILVHVYDQAMELARVPRGSPLARAVMMALNSINRLASTVLLTGGITPVVSASLIGGIYWSQWLLLMSIPYLALLVIGSLLIAWIYRDAFSQRLAPHEEAPATPLSAREVRALVITLGASLLWLTDSLHHWNPAVPAVIAWVLLLMPRIGVVSLRDFNREVGWSSFIVIASSMSLARALMDSGGSAWIAGLVVGQVPAFRDSPMLIVAAIMLASVPVRMLIPNITGFLATTIPIAMSIGATTGVNPMLCGLAVMIAGDAVLYYPAQSASSLVVHAMGHLGVREIFLFGVWMTLVAFFVVFAVAIPWWGLVGEPLRVLSLTP